MEKSKELDNILDRCVERITVDGASIEQCLESYPEYADELKPLLETVLLARETSTIEPASEFKNRARYQFQTALQDLKAGRRWSLFNWNWQPRWAVVVSIALALLIGSSGTVYAAAGSMPDEALYPVKLATEQVQLAFTFSAMGKAELYSKLADKRVDEIVRMAHMNKPEHIEHATYRLDVYLNRIAELSSTQVEIDDTDTPPFIDGGNTSSPPGHMMGGRPDGMQNTPMRMFRSRIAGHAMSNPERMRSMMQDVPDSAKPALQRAIAVSENGYQKILKSLY